MLYIDPFDYDLVIERLGDLAGEHRPYSNYLLELYVTRFDLARTPQEQIRIMMDLAESVDLMIPIAEVISVLLTDSDVQATSAYWVMTGTEPLLAHYLGRLSNIQSPEVQKEVIHEMLGICAALLPFLEVLACLDCLEDDRDWDLFRKNLVKKMDEYESRKKGEIE